VPGGTGEGRAVMRKEPIVGAEFAMPTGEIGQATVGNHTDPGAYGVKTWERCILVGISQGGAFPQRKGGG